MDSILLKISDSSSRFQIPIGILNDLCWIPVGVGPPAFNNRLYILGIRKYEKVASRSYGIGVMS